MQFDNETDKFDQIHVRQSLKRFLPEILFMYLTMAMLGVLGNAWMASSITRSLRNSIEQHSKSLKVTYHYLLINCANDALIKCIIVLPFSVIILISLHWTFGSTWCVAFPIVQDVAFYWTSITYVLLFYFRYKMVSHIGNEVSAQDMFEHSYGLPAYAGSTTALIIALIGVLPYTVYIEFIDMSQYFGRLWHGVGFCVGELIPMQVIDSIINCATSQSTCPAT